MIKNLSKSTFIAQKPFFANTILSSMQGLIGRNFLQFDAMILPRCSIVHTFFMKMPIDILFIDAENKVLKTVENAKPWRPFIGCKGAVTTIELPIGTIISSQTKIEDCLDLGNNIYSLEKNKKEYKVTELETSASVTLNQTGKL